MSAAQPGPRLDRDRSTTESYHGLETRPFSLTPDLRFVYRSRSHRRVYEQVTEALRRREGLIVVTGEIGTGKTTLCRTLLERFEARTFVSVVRDPCLSVEELLQQVLDDFGLTAAAGTPAGSSPAGASRHELVTTLQRFLSTLIPLEAHAVLIVDEAQHLRPDVLEQIRLLSNFETDDAKLLQIVLVGQSDLDLLLRRGDMRQLDQRVARRLTLAPLSFDEVRSYIDRRLSVAQGRSGAAEGEAPSAHAAQILGEPPPVAFTSAASRAIAVLSRGIPRVINIVCDRALEVACERQTHTVDAPMVLAAAARMKIRTSVAVSLLRTRTAALAAGMLLLIGAPTVWQWSSRPLDVVPTEGSGEAVPSAAAAASVPSQNTVLSPAVSAVTLPVETMPAAPVAPAQQSSVPATGASAQTRYSIAVASFKTAQRARGVAAQLEGIGLPAHTRFDQATEWHQIVVGPYETDGEALAAQHVLAAQGFDGTAITLNPLPDVR